MKIRSMIRRMASLAWACPHCYAQNPEGAVQCTNCGRG